MLVIRPFREGIFEAQLMVSGDNLSQTLNLKNFVKRKQTIMPTYTT